jgi:hypothetical protein
MADDDVTTAREPDTVREINAKPDYALAALVGVVNSLGSVEIGVTLYTGGGIVSGLLISGRSYFDRINQLLSDSRGEVAAAFGSGLFGRIADDYREKETANRDDAEERNPDDEPPVGFIHLRAATVHAPGVGQPIEQGLWRGRMTAVSGWSLGNFEMKPPPDQ